MVIEQFTIKRCRWLLLFAIIIIIQIKPSVICNACDIVLRNHTAITYGIKTSYNGITKK